MKDNRFVVSYAQDNKNQVIVVLKDTLTGEEYLEIISDNGIAVTSLKDAIPTTPKT